MSKINKSIPSEIKDFIESKNVCVKKKPRASTVNYAKCISFPMYSNQLGIYFILPFLVSPSIYSQYFKFLYEERYAAHSKKISFLRLIDN
jgi:hypothetical protein